MTIALIAACTIIYFLGRLWPGITQTLVFSPWLGEDQPYRFLGSAFLHADFWHLAFNMYALWLVGQALEPALGRWRFTALYILSAAAGNAAVAALADPTGASWGTFVVGASGAVFGLFGSIFVLFKGKGTDTTALVILLAINTVLGFVMTGISWQSHLGGLIAGAVLTFAYMMRAKRGRRGRIWLDSLATLGVAALIALVARTAYM